MVILLPVLLNSFIFGINEAFLYANFCIFLIAFDFTSLTDLTIVFFVIFVSFDVFKVLNLIANRFTASMRLFVISLVKTLYDLIFNLDLSSSNNF